MIRCDDWIYSPAGVIGPLISAEVADWRRELDWDVSEAWRVIEPARAAGQLPGLVARDEHGSPVGWASYLLYRNCLQVMALVGRNAAVSRRLLARILESPESAAATTVLICVRESSGGLRGALLDRAFAVEPYRYLSASLADAPARAPMSTTVLRAWMADRDPRAMTRLCATAYAVSTRVRAFAPHGAWEEWRDYIQSLLVGPGCGHFEPDWSLVAPGRSASHLRGGAIVTRIAPDVAHVAQMAVVPEAQGEGLGRAIVGGAMSAAAASGCRAMTLLVAASNTRAVRLYERLGFSDRGVFVVATRSQPRVSTNFALATGGASTRL